MGRRVGFTEEGREGLCLCDYLVWAFFLEGFLEPALFVYWTWARFGGWMFVYSSVLRQDTMFMSTISGIIYKKKLMALFKLNWIVSQVSSRVFPLSRARVIWIFSRRVLRCARLKVRPVGKVFSKKQKQKKELWVVQTES